MDTLHELLESTERYGHKRRLSESEMTTALSLAWYYYTQHHNENPDLPLWRFGQVAVWHTLAGRDLPGCATPPADALRHGWQGGGMGQTQGRDPEPVLLAICNETAARINKLPRKTRKAVRMLLKGMRSMDVAERLGVSPARVSQMAREAVEFLRQE